MRIVTRPDFDDVVCAALLHEAEQIIDRVAWVSPNDMQKRRVQICPGGGNRAKFPVEMLRISDRNRNFRLAIICFDGTKIFLSEIRTLLKTTRVDSPVSFWDGA